jgi:nucleotide-binding universal stress UspA family protein
MTVAVAHQVASASNQIALQVAAHEAALRETDLAVLHIVNSLDLDVSEAYQLGLSDEVDKALEAADAVGVSWHLHLGVGEDDIAEKVLKLAKEVDASLLVIGARRRSPMGKFLLGSVTQTLILDADMPVVVVKPSR